MRTLSMGALALISTVLILTGCAQERPPIDRVQPFALDKTLFVGESLLDTSDDPEFWTQATLVDVGYGAAQSGLFNSTYAQPMSRIKWQVTEDLLIGRIAYERIDGSDGKGLGGPVQDGVIAVAFRILKHFDIEMAYNSTTGERLNIRQENSVDRPWYERRYMRVDWSRNLNVDSYDFDTLSMLGVYGGITYESMAYDVTDPHHPDAPVFELEGGYFDITSKAFARPQMIDLSHLGWGINSFPACFLPNDFMGGTSPSGSCNPVEITVRHSFRRVVDTDYEPMDWDGYRFSAYGAFTVERMGYTRNYGMTDDRWRRFISRYNIWERSHFYRDPEAMTGAVECYTPATTPFGQDPHRDEDENGTEDECEDVGLGSRCDAFSQKCTLPYQLRTARPVVWYYTEGSDLEYFEGSREATHQWDVAIRSAVQTAKYAECKRIQGTECEDSFPVYFGQQEMNEDLVNLAREVDDCRDGRAYTDRGRDEAQCAALADELGEARDYDAGVIATAKLPQMVVLCHSPVEYSDPEGCGEDRLPPELDATVCSQVFEDPWSFPRREGDEIPPVYETCLSAHRVRPGDLRYHQVNVIETPQTPSPWGIYTDAEDPLTGETISASINVWSWVNDFWGQRVVDKIRYLEGELSTDEITEGDYVKRWSEAARHTSSGTIAPGFDQAGVDERIADFAGVSVEEMQSMELPEGMSAKVQELMAEIGDVKAMRGAPSQSRAIYSARAAHAHGTEFEAELMTPSVQKMMGVSSLPLSDEILDRASPLRGGHPGFEHDVYHLKQMALAERGACVMHEAEAPIAMSGLAEIVQRKFGSFDPSQSESEQQERAEKMRRYISQRAHTAVIMHEMGHSVGMRHNFVSSSDALGYRPQYWQLRTRNGEVTRECRNLGNGENCIGPRYRDPVTDNERENLLTMFMHSSVMDYAGESTQDFMGLGVYDFAAARMFYGDVVSVYNEDSYRVGGPRAQGLLGKTDSFGGILGFTWFNGNQGTVHYSQLQNLYDLIRGCEDVGDAEAVRGRFKPASWDDETMGRWDPVLDGQLVSVDGETYSRCETPPVDYVQWDSLRNPRGNEASGGFRGGVAVDPSGRIRVPYGFGTDSWADVGNLSVYRHDNGADAYELFDFFIAKQEIDHIFTNYRRSRTGFSVRSAAGRTLGRYNTKLRDAAKGLGLYRNLFSQALAREGYNMDEAWPVIAAQNFQDNILAAGMAFDHFSRMLARPEHGPHFLDDEGVLRSSRDYITLTRGTPDTEINIPNGPTGFYDDVGIGGRPLENTLANDQGEFDSSYTMNAGSYYEKMYAAMLFTESADNFISASRTDFLDARDRAVSLADLFPDGYRRMLANALTGDDAIKGPRLEVGRNGSPQTDSEGYPETPIGWTTWWGSEPRVCFPNRGNTVCTVVGNEDGDGLDPETVGRTGPIDPQIGWEQQKFLIAWTLLYLMDNQRQNWLDMMRVWELGQDADPRFENRIEFHYPTGKVYVAKTFGTERIFGKTVQKGIAARVLEYANELLAQAYVLEDGPDVNGDGQPDWGVPVFDDDGQPIVRFSPGFAPTENCNPETNEGCTCAGNLSCMELTSYVSVPFFLRQTIDAYGLSRPTARGVY